MLTRYACTAAELSCVIGNIFAELSPPCAACGAEVLQITGTTVTGNAATLTYCKELLFFIELSQEMGFISMSSCEYWSKLALEVKYMTTAWKKRDKTRA